MKPINLAMTPIAKTRTLFCSSLFVLSALLANSAHAAIININSYPRLTGETHDTPRFQRALAACASGDTLKLNASQTYTFATEVVWKSNLIVDGEGATGAPTSVMKTTTSGVTVIEAINITNTTFRDIKVEGLATSGTATGVWGTDVTNCDFINLVIGPTQAAGFGFSEDSTGNSADYIWITNTGSHCFQLWDASGTGVQYNSFDHMTISTSRDQICASLNGSDHNTFGTVSVTLAKRTGFLFDGNITPYHQSSYNTVTNLTANNTQTGTESYFGAYFAAGTSNVVTNLTANYNKFNGVKDFGTSNYTYNIVTAECDLAGIYVTHVGAQTTNETYTGTVDLFTHNNWIGESIGNIPPYGGINAKWSLIGNRTPGLVGYKHKSQWNTSYGIYVNKESINNFIYKPYVQGNGGIGVYAQAGGTPYANYFMGLNSTGNPAGNTYWGTTQHIWSAP